MEHFERLVVSRLKCLDKTEEVELECGHRITEIVPTKDTSKYCTACFFLFLKRSNVHLSSLGLDDYEERT